MKQFFLLLFLSFCLIGTTQAQRTITGNVSDEDGNPLIGATILAVGTTSGTATDIDGSYSLSLPEGVTAIRASYTGYTDQTIDLGAENVVDIVMTYDVMQINEVVVTASGIERQRKDLGYSISTIGGDELTVARENNVINSLQGKTSGVQISNQSGNLGGSTKILIRGINSLSGNNNPLWVVDGVPIFDTNIQTGSLITGGFDVGNRAQDINPDDIESISILKGAAAAALYGSRAANGAIIVTTKRGKKSARANISVSSSLRFDSPLRLPDYQNEFAQGNNGKFDVNSLNGWGPRINGQTVTDFTGEETQLQAHPNNVEDFYETGVFLVNNVALSGANETSDYRLSFTALNQSGIFPNSELDRYTVSLNSGMQFAQKISSRFGVNYVRTTSQGNVAQGANDPNVLASIITGLPRNIDVGLLNPWIDESTGVGQQLNPLTEMTNNPYWIAHENRFDTEVDRLYGNFELKYEPALWLDFISRVGYDVTVDDRFRSNRKGTLGRVNGDFTEDRIQQRQLDYNFIASANKDLSEDLFLKVNLGFNYNSRVLERSTVLAQELSVDQLFSFGNANVTNPSNDFTERRLFGIYGDVTLSYKEWLSLNVTGRNDWTSTLPLSNNSYFYPSFNLAFIFTDALNIESNILSYGKLRASYANVGNDTDPYQLSFLYNPQTTAFGQFGTSTTFPFNGTLAFSGPGTIPPGNSLRPEDITSIEFGTELQFYEGRFGLDLTYYDVTTKDQILAIPIPESTGYNFKRINVGQTSNSGIELELNADVIRGKDLRWNTLVTFTSNNFQVDELADGVDRLVINSGFNSIQIVAEPGKTFGLYGNQFLRASSDSTKIVVDPNTGLRQTGENGRLGDVYPTFIAGWTNNISWKGLNLRFTLDWRNGGVIYSETVQNLRSTGLAEETAANREGAFIDSEAFIENADGTLTPNNIPVRMEDFWGNYAAGNIAEANVFDASFVKVREIGLSYALPAQILEGTPIRGLTFGVEARNPFLLYSAIPHIDPETNLFGSAQDGAGVEFNSPPTARSFGFNLKVVF